MRIEHIQVENIKCGGCANTIRRELLHQPGVLSVHVDDAREEVTIDGEDNLDREHLVSLLAHLGYPEKGNNSLIRKAKSYVSCAIGRLSPGEEEPK